MPRILRIIAVVESLAGVFVLFATWFGSEKSFLLGFLLLLSGLITAALFVALAEILENSERTRSELGALRDDLWRELEKLRQGGPASGRPPSPPPPRPSTSPIRESTDPVTGRATYLYNGLSYDSRLAALAQLSEDERRGQRQPRSSASD
ncbi:hypothetical protein [Inquilinus sp. CA228]|uniref:hypothetical protein n=1 Tax=Inquilinus sp. CA228 TaxID=3455609 RepID=UPI003F8D20EB